MKENSEKLVLSNVEESIGYITLNRPEYLNAFNLDLANQFLKVVNLFNDDKKVRAIVIKGAGKIF